MAITKIHPIQRSVLAAVNYITDKSKTDGELLVSSYACAVHTADLEFAQTASLGTKRGDIKAQHLIQAFAPGEVSPSLAHEIGMKLAMEVTGGKYEFVLATHVDKNHVHNHILFNQVDFIDFKKYRGNIYCQREIAKISDRLCSIYGLSVINNPKDKGLAFKDYRQLNRSPGKRMLLKSVIDSCIPLVSSFDELLVMLSKLDYQIKTSGDSFSLKKSSDERFVRLKSLGYAYSVDAIKERILYNKKSGSPYITHSKNEIGLLKDLSDRLDQIKNPAYQNKVAISSIKQIAATYAFLNEHDIHSSKQIAALSDKWAADIKKKRNMIKELESQIDSLSKIVSALEYRDMYNDIYKGYINCKKNPDYKNKYAYQIASFVNSCTTLSANNVPPGASFLDYRNKLSDLINEKDLLLSSYRQTVSDLKQLDAAGKNVNALLHLSNEKDKHDKPKHSLKTH